jgi:hypothetical protein
MVPDSGLVTPIPLPPGPEMGRKLIGGVGGVKAGVLGLLGLLLGLLK